MKRIILLTLFLSGCSLFAPPPRQPEPPKIDLVARLVNSTAALAYLDGRIFCSGVAAEGVIVTAAHCVLQGEPFNIIYGGGVYKGVATLVWESQDLAFVDAIGARLKEQLPLTTWTPVVGQKVVWFGYPEGVESYMGVGIVANPSSSAPWAEGFVAIYGQFIGGNSGGPVVDESGALMGVVSSTLLSRGETVPIGYVVPPKAIREALDTI